MSWRHRAGRLAILSVGSATLGVVGWSGNPSALPLAMAFPALWSLAGSRASAALIAAIYFLGASRGLPEGVSIFFGSDLLLGLALWVIASLAFVTVHTAFWTAQGGWHGPTRYLIANVLMSLPPLGIVGWANPLTAAGIIFPGWGWLGLAMAMALLMLATTKHRWPAVAIVGVFSLASAVLWVEPEGRPGWVGIDTSFSAGREQYADYHQQVATIGLVKAAAADGASFVVLPESALGIWTPTTEALWRESLVGMPVTMIGGGVVLQANDYENLMITVTSAGSNELYRQRMPVPISMWQPWSAGGADADFFRNAVVELAGLRLAVLLCYEQLLVWPVLHSVWMQPEIMVATGNAWWTGSTNILPIQRAASIAWARLFNLPLTMAYNAPD
ncbi:conjugal transfer protein TraB [Devosia riboflavina]|uniref:Conjugal transfer protein TraB n=2 Tax=Devosia riboflavina TaxID=46914 RepID=A0A087LYR4_9HYPH|nr:conjugal transfer protein TraB [Devosia riboflavina]